MSLTFEQLQKVWDFHKKFDDLVESFQFSHKSMKLSLDEVYKFLVKEIKASAFYVETKNEKLINVPFCYGNCNEDFKLWAPMLDTVDETVRFSVANTNWFAQAIDVDNHIIGTIAVGFDNTISSETEDFYSEILNAISELLDSYFYGIQSSSIKQSIIMGLQDALTDHDIVASFDKAINILYRVVKFKRLLVVYNDREIVCDKNVKYIFYEKNKHKYDNYETPSTVIDRLIRSKDNFLFLTPDELSESLNSENMTISYLTKGMDKTDSIGFIAIETANGKNISILGQELLQIFSEELRQRLVDLNREKNILRKYFSNSVITKLLTSDDYEERFLKARDAEIGIVFADISGFTKMSEQILKTPDRITSFVNKWAKGVVTRLFPLGATLDKLIGDCAMFLFGPPFYNEDKETIVRHMLHASKQIIKYTKRFLASPENADIQQHPDFNKFGVSIGVNFCHCTVGLIGPNQDLTAFSSGVNITARLQGIAGTNEILVTECVKDIADKKNNNWVFSDKESTKVKNVELPLGYYRLKN